MQAGCAGFRRRVADNAIPAKFAYTASKALLDCIARNDVHCLISRDLRRFDARPRPAPAAALFTRH